MSLYIVETSQEPLVCDAVAQALLEGVRTCGSAVLLVPSFAQALDAQRELAAIPGLGLAVDVTTPSAWVKERWEVWGDGRAIATGVALSVLSRAAIIRSTPEELGPLRLSEGLVSVVSQLVGQALPWFPMGADGLADADACASCGLTAAETCLVALALRVRDLLAEHGLVSSAEAASAIVGRLEAAGASMPQVVVAGFSQMVRRDRSLVADLAAVTDVTFVARLGSGPAFEQTRLLLSWFDASGSKTVADEPTAGVPSKAVQRHPQLTALRDALFGADPISLQEDGPLRLLQAAGPVAEAELVAEELQSLVRVLGPESTVVVATPDVERASRELLPKLAARDVPVRLQLGKPMLSCPSAQAFLSYARMVARLVELDSTWPQPVEGLEGRVAQLGDMSWWPPRDLSDFLLNDISHVGARQAWRADATWRGNRLLNPARLLEMLQSERDTSASVARATTELLRGRIGTAASKLLLPYVAGVEGAEPGGYGDASAQPSLAHKDAYQDVQSEEAAVVLQAFLQLAGTLRELGVTADPAVSGAVPLTELVELMEWAATGMRVVARTATASQQERPPVRIMTPAQASELAPGSVDALVVCGLTTAEQPISASDDLQRALLEQFGIEPPANPMAQARNSFYQLVSVPRQVLVLERALHDADSKPTYPSVMLSELLAACGAAASAHVDGRSLPVTSRPETALAQNLSPDGHRPREIGQDDPAPAGWLSAPSRHLVFVPQDGSDTLPDGKPLLSASQVETYLDCPYKWFSLRRLRLGTVDAGHTGMEMGTFAHRVLEVTHRELLTRALEAEGSGLSREELLAAIEADPARHVAGSRVTADNLPQAEVVLDLEFDLHQQHMYMVRRPRQVQQLLVAHDSSDRAQEDQLRKDLLSSLGYQTHILEGFEPRLFEWSFGRHGNLVEYAGAYFTGTVDRIDVSPHGTAVIIDYKHKSPAGFAAEYDALQDGVIEGERLPNRVQSLIYAQVVRRAFAGKLRLVGTTYLSTKSPHALAGAASENVVDLVFGRVSKQRLPRVSVPAKEDGGDGMEALLDRTEELVGEQVKQMLAGNIEARPRDRHSCDFCPVMQCERRVAR